MQICDGGFSRMVYRFRGKKNCLLASACYFYKEEGPLIAFEEGFKYSTAEDTLCAIRIFTRDAVY